MASFKRFNPQSLTDYGTFRRWKVAVLVAKLFLCTRHWSDHFPCIHSFNPYTTLWGGADIPVPQMKNRSTAWANTLTIRKTNKVAEFKFNPRQSGSRILACYSGSWLLGLPSVGWCHPQGRPKGGDSGFCFGLGSPLAPSPQS